MILNSACAVFSFLMGGEGGGGGREIRPLSPHMLSDLFFLILTLIAASTLYRIRSRIISLVEPLIFLYRFLTRKNTLVLIAVSAPS